ncbi:hypothetical protein BU26DRAFT_34912 [Trematosphaeria pertusa]|uniref:Uncharacterized protein n=1 Tax=Trematosphaeria pertusa TaxID=390896 RepID=A0A6A6J589_9PLEO|nr:uncharacterized protein BU26DRAFT_34912 [Trematosphaeria pertusa]KAF2257050.1 hypothetical protein BU26DRAFT_34912 [Trematosphaeria pertusa]
MNDMASFRNRMTAGLSAHYADVITSKLGVSPYAAIPEAYRPSTGANITCSENLLRNLAELTALVPDLASFQNRITKAMERRGHNRTVGGTKYYLSASDVIVAVLETQEAMDRSLRGQPGRRGLAINFGKAQEQERQAYLTKPVTATKITRESESSGSPLNGLGDEIDVAVKRRQEDAMGNPLVAHSLEPASSSWTPNSVSEPVRSQQFGNAVATQKEEEDIKTTKEQRKEELRREACRFMASRTLGVLLATKESTFQESRAYNYSGCCKNRRDRQSSIPSRSGSPEGEGCISRDQGCRVDEGVH